MRKSSLGVLPFLLSVVVGCSASSSATEGDAPATSEGALVTTAAFVGTYRLPDAKGPADAAEDTVWLRDLLLKSDGTFFVNGTSANRTRDDSDHTHLANEAFWLAGKAEVRLVGSQHVLVLKPDTGGDAMKFDLESTPTGVKLSEKINGQSTPKLSFELVKDTDFAMCHVADDCMVQGLAPAACPGQKARYECGDAFPRTPPAGFTSATGHVCTYHCGGCAFDSPATRPFCATLP